jgi:hypothetical protein
MNSRRWLIVLAAAALFVWGCGDDDPADPGDGGGTGPAVWSTAGGDFAATASATVMVNLIGDYRWGSTAQMVADVENWLANPDQDFGWLLMSEEAFPDTISVKRFDTRENGTEANRPKLTVYHDGSSTPTVIPAAKDNTLYEDPEGDASNGAGEHLFAGRTAEMVDNLRRGLIAFQVSDSLGASTVVDSVFLDLHMSKTPAITPYPLPFPISLHRVSADWGEGTSVGEGGGEGIGGAATEGDATWLYRFFEP